MFATFMPFIVWIIITVVFVVLEFVTPAYLLPIGLGAGIAAIASLINIPLFGQVIVFAVVAVLAFALFRPNRQRGKKGRGDEPIDMDF